MSSCLVLLAELSKHFLAELSKHFMSAQNCQISSKNVHNNKKNCHSTLKLIFDFYFSLFYSKIVI